MLRFDAEGWYADNTDGAGLVHDLIENLGVTLGGKHVVVLGAGGAARGILQPILDAHPAAITVSTASSPSFFAARAGSPRSCAV